MTPAFSLLLAAEGTVRRTFEWGRIQSNTDWILPIAACVLVLVYVRMMYRRDAAELRAPVGWLLTGLRTLVFLGLLFYWLQPQWRTEEEKVINSRAVLLVDSSLSMGIGDDEAGDATGTPARIQQVASALAQSDLIEKLRKVHDVAVYQFDDELHRDRIVALPKLRPQPAAEEPASPTRPGEARADEPAGRQAAGAATDDPPPPDWSEVFKLSGQETRLGQSLEQLLGEESTRPLSGVILISDGGQNAGIGPQAAVKAAREAKAPVCVVGVGSDKLPPSVRVAAFNPPPRAYPGDPYSASGVVQAWRMAGQVVTVQLLSRDAGGPGASEPGTGNEIDSTQVTLGADGEEVPVKFEITPDQVGRRTMCLKVLAPEADRRRDDNLLEADIEIVEQKNRVLLFAGGPMREYQFLRNQLYRDRSSTVDVLLQTAAPGISQDAQKILDDFPATAKEMDEYDCVVAFDPDWLALSAEQMDVLESWVAERGGGLIVIPGNVNAGNTLESWIRESRARKIRDLYPVEFQRSYASLRETMSSREEPWPLEFTREGLEADFIQPADTPVEGRQVWAAFPGVYSFFPVRGPKEAATVLARFSDPRSAYDDQLPVYLAWQFYGSGRVFYLGSGETWRLRMLDPTYFERFYTKLIRFVSKGRLLRGSSRGVLLVAQERYRVGNTVEVQAYRLADAQLDPLTDESVDLQVVQPTQKVQTVRLARDPARPGTYAGQFTVFDEGDYRLELPLPDSENELLRQRIRVEIPNLEREAPQRNDALLSEIAEDTGGTYVVGLTALMDSGAGDLLGKLADKTKTIVLTASPSPLWEQTWLRWLMYSLCGLLALEWLLRRLLKLA